MSQQLIHQLLTSNELITTDALIDKAIFWDLKLTATLAAKKSKKKNIENLFYCH